MNSIKTPLLLVSVLKGILKDDIVKAYINFLSNLYYSSDFDTIVSSYSDFISKLYEKQNNQNLYLYLKELIYTDKNIISMSSDFSRNSNIINTLKYELSLFDNLLSYSYEKVKSDLILKFQSCTDLIEHMPVYNTDGYTQFDINDILNFYNKNGYGIFSRYKAFKFTEDNKIIPVKYFNALNFKDLKNYEYQKEVIERNTRAFLEGKQANNILLYGDRGCGKSSTVKALINEFKDYNLKIIQVYKESFIYLSELFEQIRNLPLKFIIFADDISFNEEDKNFSSIKAVLEGSLSDKPDNTIIYATTNRVHLVKESFLSREGNEVHCNDTIDETVSLSDRFGIMLTFTLLTKTEYLDIVSKIAEDENIQVTEELLKKAEEFSALKAIRTPRVARQFITDYLTEI